MRRAEGWQGRRRGPGMALGVIAIHLLIALGLWQALRTREVEVARDRAALMWLQPPKAQVAPPAKVAPPTPTPTKRAQPRPVAPPAPLPPPPHESTWVQPAPVAAAPAASAASQPPLERLLDTEATRMAIRQSARQPLLHERTAQATGMPIERTDTALGTAVAEAGTPDCLRDGQAASGQVGPIGLGGILGLPFLAARVATGKCAK